MSSAEHARVPVVILGEGTSSTIGELVVVGNSCEDNNDGTNRTREAVFMAIPQINGFSIPTTINTTQLTASSVCKESNECSYENCSPDSSPCDPEIILPHTGEPHNNVDAIPIPMYEVDVNEVDLNSFYNNNKSVEKDDSQEYDSCDKSVSSQQTAPTTTLEYTSSLELPDTKEGIEELCPVCGDKVSGYHYGLETCESCKGFFKRTVQNKKVYTCVADGSCQIDKTQRKRCPFCRFQKCIKVGMKLEAVRADRMRGGRNKFGPMYKRDRARKLQLQRNRQINPGNMSNGRLTSSSGVGITYSPSTGFATSGQVQIKEEIQSPFLSSSTSSPDSSPLPMSGQQIINTSGSELSLWVTPGQRGSRVPMLVRQLTAQLEDQEWQNSLFSLLQNKTYNQCEVDLFELTCNVLDHNLFAQVDWARNSMFFKELRVDDQMKLLQHTWSGMLILDHLHQRIHNKLQDELPLPNGQKFDLLSLALLGTTEYADRFHHIMNKLVELKFDISDYVCLKFIILLNPDARNLHDRRSVQVAYDQVKQTQLEYCLAIYPDDQDRYQKLLDLLPEIHFIADKGEHFLYIRHFQGAAPSQTLLMEMLHTRRR